MDNYSLYSKTRITEFEAKRKYQPHELLVMLRQRSGFTKSELAKLLGFNSERMLQKWEGGYSVPTAERLRQLIELYHNRNVFVAGKELEEVRLLWNTIQNFYDATHPSYEGYPVFDGAWFEKLFREQAGTNLRLLPAKPVNPEPSVPDPLPNETTTSTTNLPAALTPFIGRQLEVEAICKLMNKPEVRLITLYGTAGIGKTRLAISVAEKLQNQFQDGVFFVNLAAANSLELGLDAILQTLDLQDYSHLSLVDKLKHNLQKRELLLVMDNFEQIVALGSVISELLLSAPQIKILITSRVVLQLYGEYVYNVPTLKLPVLNDETTFETLVQNEAIQLFVQRASMVNPDFSLNETNAENIAKLCLQLEGLPLSIELAAARSNVFSPQLLLNRLAASNNGRLSLLVNGFSNLPPRHQTLSGALEWSYQLLTEPERDLFRKLGVFVGSFTLAAAEALSNDTTTTLETVTSLVNKSLLKLTAALPDEGLRFTMLETIREYALGKLVETGELEVTRNACNLYIILMVEQATNQLNNSKELNWLKRLSADYSNILNTLDYLIQNQAVEQAFRLGSSFWMVFWRWGYLSQGREWLDKILRLDRTKVDNILLAKVLNGAAYLALHQTDYNAASGYFEQSIKIWQENGASKDLGNSLSGLAGAYRILGKYDEALELNYSSLKIFRELGEAVNEADSLCNIGWQLLEQGRYDGVLEMLEQSLALHKKAGYLSGIARTKIYLGDILWRQGEVVSAVQHLEEAVTSLHELNNHIQLPHALNRLGLVYLCEGQPALAEKAFKETILIAEEMQKIVPLTLAYSNLGLLRLTENNLAEAERLFQKSVDFRNEIGQLEGVLWSLEGLAVVAIRQARYEDAQKLIAEASSLRQTIAAPILPHTAKYIWSELENFRNLNQ